ncbi:glycine cleavage system protein GcvH [Brachybacterium sp. AOP25-B2-12]|uniref:glycine cleavage system protein GcvH n=1 Tax=Brachybacterium sp. AOP25-B2-12 TaxID=3457710 RepID=UPI004033781B
MADTDDLSYSKDHEWIRLDGDSVATVGVTAFAAGQLGDVVYVDLPDVDAEVTAGTEMGEIESTKSVSDLFSPLDGTILEVNGDVVDSPEIVNASPFGEGWLVRVRYTTLPDDLLTAQQYAELIGE